MNFVCEVCDEPDRLETIHGCTVHLECAPKSWPKEDETHSEFMAKVRVLARTRGERWARWKL